MLTKKEEELVEHLLVFLAIPNHREKLAGSQSEWLAQKLLEVNNECSRVTLELQKANEELAAYVERYEG